MDLTNLLGIGAGILTTVSFVPQVYKTYLSKSAKDLSLGMFLVFFCGVCLWLVYGIMKADPALIMSNFFTLLLSGILLVFKFIYKD